MPDKNMEQHWSSVGDEIQSRPDENLLAGDDAPYYRYKADLFSTKFLPLVPVEARAVLDVGCGAGRTLKRLAARHPRRLVGCDQANQMVALAKKNLGDSAEIFLVDGELLPFS